MKKLGIVLLFSILFLACKDKSDPTEPTVDTPNLITVDGVVYDFNTGAPVEGVRVTVGTESSVTDSQGEYSISFDETAGRAIVNFKASGYTENSKPVIGNANVENFNIQLLPVTQSFTFDAGAPQSLNVDNSTAGLDFGGNVFVNIASRAIATGDLTANLTVIDPSLSIDLMPGDMTVENSGSISNMESYGALGVTIEDASGNELEINSGSSSTVRIALPSQNAGTPPSSIPLFYYDSESGRWIEEGVAYLMGTSPNQYYQGTVYHFSTWNADILYDSVTIIGKVIDSDLNPIVNASVKTEGADYNGTSTAWTDANGIFSIEAKPNSTVFISAVKDGQESNTITVYTGDAGTTMDYSEIESYYLMIGSLTGTATIKLTWGDNPSDLDSHLTGPIENSADRFHVFYSSKGSMTVSPYAQLDVDDTSSFGPEVITITKLLPGTYRYSVHHYSGSSTISGSPARVELNVDGSTRVFNPPGSSLGDDAIWTVFELVVSSGGITVNTINTISQSAVFSPSVRSLSTLDAVGKRTLPGEILEQF